MVGLLLDAGRRTPFTKAAWRYVALASADERHHFLREWGEQDRAGHIPFGYPQNMPMDWEPQNELDGDIWRVCCGTKNEDTIEYFITEVLPRMSLEVLFCETCVEDGHPDYRVAMGGQPRMRLVGHLGAALRQVDQTGS